MNHEILEFKYPKEFDQNFRFIYKEINCPFRVTKSSKYVLANLKY